MTESNTSSPDTVRRSRQCPSCATDLDHTGEGSDELLECPQCGLVMFDQLR
jgi:uncharacterized Zn finger protein